MDWEEIIQLICVLLTGAATAIPLVIKLVEYVKKAAIERNWRALLELMLDLMEDAEQIFDSGQQRRDYVLGALDKLSGTLGCSVDEQEMGELIDRLCSLSKSLGK